MLVSVLSLLIACGPKAPTAGSSSPEPDPAPVEQTDPTADPTGDSTSDTDESVSLPGNPTVLSPSWGAGPSEIWQGDDMVGIAYVEVSAGSFTEHVAMFEGTLSADTSTRWDATLDGMAVYPPYVPSTTTGSVGNDLTVKPWRRCTAKDTCSDCGQSSCFTDFADFKSKVWTQLAQRLGKTKAQVEGVSKEYAETDSFSRVTFSVSACDAPSVTEYSPARNNGLQKDGSDIGWVHMGIDSSDSSKRYVRQAIDSRYQSLPWVGGTITQDESYPGSTGPYQLDDWCDEVDTWCGTLPTGASCIYSEMHLSYPNSW